VHLRASHAHHVPARYDHCVSLVGWAQRTNEDEVVLHGQRTLLCCFAALLLCRELKRAACGRIEKHRPSRESAVPENFLDFLEIHTLVTSFGQRFSVDFDAHSQGSSLANRISISTSYFWATQACDQVSPVLV
jgi:hypothetical protein